MEHYLTQEHVVFLNAVTKKDALREMAGVLCRQDDGLDLHTVMEALLRRERILSSRIAPRIALPHALLPDAGRPIVALGYSAEGIPWDSPGDEPVNLVILSICGRSYGREHVAMMAAIAGVLRDPVVLERAGQCADPTELYELMCRPHPDADRLSDADRCGDTSGRLLLQHAEQIARETAATSLMVLDDSGLSASWIREHGGSTPWIVVRNDTVASPPDLGRAGRVLSIPGYGLERAKRVKLAMLFALSCGCLSHDDTVVCLSGDAGPGAFSVVEIVDVGREFEALHAFRSRLEAGDISLHVFHRVLQMASALAIEGREGKPVGAIFVIGDYQNVQRHCYQMVINPFRGYPENERNVLDPALEETIKEFSRVDGAFLIRGDGIMMSLGSYIQPEDTVLALQSGLGARHAAGMGITTTTQALSIVLSESTRRISLYQQGQLIVALGRERVTAERHVS